MKSSAVRYEAPQEADAAALRRGLADWFETAQRDMPWRNTRDPYAVWVSEAMLQQTRVETVLDYWPRFLERFPTVSDLAAAEEEAVLEAWSGLGYYRRARSLQAAAQVIDREHGGVFPKDLDVALSLPGIGPYTAGAVLSIAYDVPAPLVDGNVERVFSRLFALDGVRGSGPLLRASWAAAADLIGRDGDRVAPRVWNQALMELGATICKPTTPACDACPVAGLCRARAAGNQAELPRPKPKAEVIEVHLEIYVIESEGGELLLARRPGDGRMAGMWEFPTVELTTSGLFPPELAGAMASGVEAGAGLFSIRHGITRHRIRADVRAAAVPRAWTGSAPEGTRWVVPAAAEALALTGMAKKVLGRLDPGDRSLFASEPGPAG